MYADRYIFDALYGRVSFPTFLWKVLPSPEVQRLREVRLCNINSLCLTGGANINRFEHSLGTAHLAIECLDAWPSAIESATKRQFILAALLHDVGTAPFGHSVQYVLDRDGFEHQSFQDFVLPERASQNGRFAYQHARMESVFFGMPKRLSQLLENADIEPISEMVAGTGSLGQLLSGSVDLDNIDNVFRLAYHIGLTPSGDPAIALARALTIRRGELTVQQGDAGLLEEWYLTRQRLYRYLLLNPDEFSAKCMLEEALLLAHSGSDVSFSWHDVDYELLSKLATSSSPDVSAIVSRLMLGDLYGCAGIYTTADISAYEKLLDLERRGALENRIAQQLRKSGSSALKNASVSIHAIKDVNKTDREIRVRTTAGQTLQIGSPSRRVLIGVFFRNVRLSMNAIRPELVEEMGVVRVIKRELKSALGDRALRELIPYAESRDSYRDNAGDVRSRSR